uniref:Uncharacterized protein n=1 Tax=Vertebrata thuyoides TaxID=2006970 RepID=A0A1Z1MB58_9FLOR|nr:hypothetical protein [Vertebrata thuyoides]ARW63112.1 hypothetical protein [Vertebrata thuyoides]
MKCDFIGILVYYYMRIRFYQVLDSNCISLFYEL